uniref:Uncharacterized protein n=1 Tax=Mycena chlorophos TaxID=658473 RepID=A0ABQ0LVP4_MYCCL|nr:predicted protein [Mycena chlorophos]
MDLRVTEAGPVEARTPWWSPSRILFLFLGTLFSPGGRPGTASRKEAFSEGSGPVPQCRGRARGGGRRRAREAALGRNPATGSTTRDNAALGHAPSTRPTRLSRRHRRWPQAPCPLRPYPLLASARHFPEPWPGRVWRWRMVAADVLCAKLRHSHERRRGIRDAMGERGGNGREMQWARAPPRRRRAYTDSSTLGQGCFCARRGVLVRSSSSDALPVRATNHLRYLRHDLVGVSESPHPHVPSHHAGRQTRSVSPPHPLHSPLGLDLLTALDDDGVSVLSCVGAQLVDFGIGEVRNGDVFAGHGPPERRRLMRSVSGKEGTSPGRELAPSSSLPRRFQELEATMTASVGNGAVTLHLELPAVSLSADSASKHPPAHCNSFTAPATLTAAHAIDLRREHKPLVAGHDNNRVTCENATPSQLVPPALVCLSAVSWSCTRRAVWCLWNPYRRRRLAGRRRRWQWVAASASPSLAFTFRPSRRHRRPKTVPYQPTCA